MTAEEIERMVHEVMRRLAARPDAQVAALDTLRMEAAKVITMTTIAGKLTGVRRLIIGPRAVVTPSVRDELRAQGIQLERSATVLPTKGSPRLLVAHPHAMDVAATLPIAAADTRLLPARSLEEAVRAMIGQLHGDLLGLIVTESPEKAVCLANRHAHVRAFWAGEVSQVRRAMASLSANVMVLDAQQTAAASLLVETFRSLAEGGR